MEPSASASSTNVSLCFFNFIVQFPTRLISAKFNPLKRASETD